MSSRTSPAEEDDTAAEHFQKGPCTPPGTPPESDQEEEEQEEEGLIEEESSDADRKMEKFGRRGGKSGFDIGRERGQTKRVNRRRERDGVISQERNIQGRDRNEDPKLKRHPNEPREQIRRETARLQDRSPSRDLLRRSDRSGERRSPLSDAERPPQRSRDRRSPNRISDRNRDQSESMRDPERMRGGDRRSPIRDRVRSRSREIVRGRNRSRGRERIPDTYQDEPRPRRYANFYLLCTHIRVALNVIK